MIDSLLPRSSIMFMVNDYKFNLSKYVSKNAGLFTYKIKDLLRREKKIQHN